MVSAKRKNKIKMLLTIFGSFAAVGLSALTLTACVNGFNPKTDIPGINNNAVLTIETNRLSFAMGMDNVGTESDTADIISRCGCVLTDDEGHEVAVTKQMLDDKLIKFDVFDVTSAGNNKQITVSYKNATNYIFYDVCEYNVRLYTDEEHEELWKSERAQAQLTDDLKLAVWVNLNNYNYSTDVDARQTDTYGAERFCGWYSDDGDPATGIYSMALSAIQSNLDLHAHYLTDAQFAALDLSYDNQGRRVFSGYSGAEPAATVPEGVTYIDIAKIFNATPEPAAIGFEVLNIPSTARLDVPLTGVVNTVGLTGINVDSGNPYYSSYNGALYSKDYKTLHFMPASCANSEFHDSVEIIGRYACAYWQCRALTFPDGIKTLQDYCFYMSSLTRVEGYAHASQGVGVFYGTNIPEMNISDGVATYTLLDNVDGVSTYNLSIVTDKTVTDYTVKEGTVSISDNAFKDCTALKSIDLRDKVEKIGNYAFSGCTALESIVLPESTERFGESIFYGCEKLTSVNMSALKQMLFVDSKGVHEDTLPEAMFRGCKSLTRIELPSFVKHIGNQAFYGCEKLGTINLAQLELETLGASAFYGAGEAGFTLTLPVTVTSIGKQAFSHSNITSINLKALINLTEFSERTFEFSQLESAEIPSGITAISTYCFYYTPELKSVKLNNVTSIASYGFGYSGLTSIDFENVKTISGNAFTHCDSLENVELTDSVTTVSAQAFTSCANLKTFKLGVNTATFGSYPIGADGKTFGSAVPALYMCFALEEITVADGNQYFSADENGILYSNRLIVSENGKSVYRYTTVGEGDAQQRVFGVLVFVPASNGMTKYELPSDVKYIVPYSIHNHATITELVLNYGVENVGKAAFYNSLKLEKFNIPASVTALGANVFLGCNSLTTVELDDENPIYESSQGSLIYEIESKTLVLCTGGTTTVEIKSGTLAIGDAVFMDNVNVKSIRIPESVKSIGSKAFDGCWSLETIYIGAGVEKIDDAAFAELISLKTIEVDPANEYFKTSADKTILYSADGKKLWLCAVGSSTITDVSGVLAGVEEIGNYAFAYHKTLKTAKLPAGVKTIGKYAFYNCKALEVFYGSPELEVIGERAFSADNELNRPTGDMRYNDSLKTVLLYGNVKDFGVNTFYGQYGIEDAYFVMTYDEQLSMTKDKTNAVYLTFGCPNPDGPGYVNNDGKGINRYINSDLQPLDHPTLYSYFHMVDGEPVVWDTSLESI